MSARLCVIDYMGKEPVPNVPVATGFVREVIGCNCPDEVFRQTAIQPGSSAGKACSSDCELRIGGRLLIVITSKSAARLSSHLVEVVAEGNRARDESKFDRFRLVVQAGKPAEESAELFRAFESISDKDERVLAKGEVPNFFSHASDGN